MGGYDVKSLNFSGIVMWTMQGIAKFKIGYITVLPILDTAAAERK